MQPLHQTDDCVKTTFLRLARQLLTIVSASAVCVICLEGAGPTEMIGCVYYTPARATDTDFIYVWLWGHEEESNKYDEECFRHNSNLNSPVN